MYPMRRSDREQSREFSLALIDRCTHGVMALSTGEDTPYCLPLSFVRVDNCLYFHGAKEGHKIDPLRKDARASFTAIDEGVRDEGGWAYTFRSVAVFGRIEFVEDHEFAIELCRELARRFNPSDADIENEIRMAGARVQVFCLVPEHITGKRVHEA